MWPFSKEKKSSSVVWRNSSGEIECKGDACPKDCDVSCPIFLNTTVPVLLAMGQNAKAISTYDKILAIAPDFYDAWNNLGGIYGSQGNYSKAKECYAKAHEIKPERSAPVFGLALVTRDLKEYDACLKWCDLYDTLEHDHKCDSIRSKITGSNTSNSCERY